VRRRLFIDDRAAGPEPTFARSRHVIVAFRSLIDFSRLRLEICIIALQPATELAPEFAERVGVPKRADY
jgi:hypothetical protein